MTKKQIDHITNTLGYWCATIGIPLCLAGVSIVIVSGIFEIEQIIGPILIISGVGILLLIFPCIIIKLLAGYAFRGVKE